MSKYKIILITIAGIAAGVYIAKKLSNINARCNSKSNNKIHKVNDCLTYIWNFRIYTKRISTVKQAPSDPGNILYIMQDGTQVSYFKNKISSVSP